MSAEIVVIGTSRGGLKALQVLLAALDAGFNLPIVIAQHRGKEADTGLSEFLGQKCLLPVTEPEDKEPVLEGHVYLAPRDYHLLIEKGSFALSTDSPVAFARPSIDVLFESVADEYQDRAIGVILTGSNADGANGLAAIKEKGGIAIVEDPATAAHSEMPTAALARVEPDWVLPLPEIASTLSKVAHASSLSYD